MTMNVDRTMHTINCCRQAIDIAKNAVFNRKPGWFSQITVRDGAKRGNYAYPQTYGLRPDGGRDEERGRVHQPSPIHHTTRKNQNVKRVLNKIF